MRSSWSRVGPSSYMTGVLTKRWPCEDKHVEKAMWQRRQRLEWCSYKLRKAKGASCHQKVGESPGIDYPPEGTNPADRDFGVCFVLLCFFEHSEKAGFKTTWFWCFKLPSLLCFVTAALGNGYSRDCFPLFPATPRVVHGPTASGSSRCSLKCTLRPHPRPPESESAFNKRARWFVCEEALHYIIGGWRND